MTDMVFFDNVARSNNSPILKLYNDKITFGVYHSIGKPRYKWVHPRYKVDLQTGALVRHTEADAYRVAKNFKSSLSRSLRKIWEIDEKNTFGYFLTFTFNQAYVNRKSAEECYRTYRNIIKRLKYTYGEMEYLTVGEFHWDESIHFHLMCNFLERKPKLKYKGRTKKGNPFYTIQDDFKKEDCFLTVEKLTTNNTEYLVKYFTKSADSPLARRFSCSHNLKRSRAVTSRRLFEDEFAQMYRNVLSMGFAVRYKDKQCCSLVLEVEHTPRGAAAGVDLFSKDTKDENTVDIQAVWQTLMRKIDNTRAIERKIFKIQRGEKLIPEQLHRQQLAFDLEF